MKKKNTSNVSSSLPPNFSTVSHIFYKSAKRAAQQHVNYEIMNTNVGILMKKLRDGNK